MERVQERYGVGGRQQVYFQGMEFRAAEGPTEGVGLGKRGILPIAILSPVSAQIADQPPSATFRSEVTEVRVTFSTTDPKNRVVSTIQPTDFAIVDQGRVIREFRSFTRSGYTRLQVTILVDGSDSLKPRLQQELSSVTELLGPDSGLPEDALSVVSFHGVKPITLCQGNCRALDLGAQFSSGPCRAKGTRAMTCMGGGRI